MIDDFGLDTGLDLGIPRKRKRRVDSFTPEAEETLLGTLGRGALSGVSMVGNLLDLPGSSVRDVIAGENPFDQWNPFDGSMVSDQNRVSGRDLLRRSGLVSNQDTYGNWWGGLGAEILLDPTTYLTLGGSALTKGGKAFKAAGVLDDAAKVGIRAGRKIGPRVSRMTTTAREGFDLLDDAGKSMVNEYLQKNAIDFSEIADQPMQSLARVELPFTGLGFNVGSGKLSQAAAGLLDTAGDFAKQTGVVRTARALFDPSVGGKLGYADQQIAEEAYKAKWKAERAVKHSHVQLLNRMSEGYKAFQESFGSVPGGAVPTMEAYDKLVRLTGEIGGNVDDAWKVVQEGGTDLPGAVKTSVRDTANSIQKLNADVHKLIEGKGGRANWILERGAEDGITEGFAHMPRYADMTPKDLADLKAGKALRTTHGGMRARSGAIRTIPAEIVNRMLSDPLLRKEGAAEEILNRFGQYLDPEFKVGEETLGKVAHAAELAGWIKEHRKRPLFTNSTPEDFLKYQTGAQVVDRNLDAIHEIVSRNMSDAGDVSVKRAFTKAGLTDQAVEHWAKKNGLSVDDAERMMVPADVANAIAATQRIYDQPEWLKTIGDGIDSWNQLWKSAVTVMFPSFHSRNFTSGQFMNVATGLMKTPEELGRYGAEVVQATKWLSGGVPQSIQEELYTSGVLGKYTRKEDVGINAINASTLPGKPPGWNVLESYRTAGDKLTASYADAVPGGRMARTLGGMAAGLGSNIAENVEFMNRVPLYMYLRKQGWSMETAARKVDDLHVDYSQLAGFEKGVMRRLVPFYSFQRRIAPVILSTILERPGGFLSQSIKASADLHNEDPLTPEHVASTLSIPNPLKGDEYEGKSYITGFGLPHEQLLQYVGGPRAVLREAASQLNPLVKGPLEWATGQSFFQAGPGGKGRDIEELDPTLGRIYANVTGAEKPPKATALEFFAANSPLSRVGTSARQLTDPRKGWDEKAINFLTGARITDVDLKAQERVVQNRALDLMKEMGARTFEKPYFPDELVEEMSPEEAAQADALELLQAALADRQKKRKKPAGK